MRLTPVLRKLAKSSVISLKNASFFRVPPSTPDAIPLFPETTLDFPSDEKSLESWAVVGASASVRTDFLNALRGQFICDPPNARTYPYLATEEIAQKDPRLRSPHHAIQYVGFDADRGQSTLRGSYLAQRYESKREAEDYTVRDYLLGKTALNADEGLLQMPSDDALERIVEDLRLSKLLDMPVNHLSNGQTRRSKIAKALLMQPEVLMLDSPFMGLDVTTVQHLSHVFENFSKTQSPRIILSLRSNEYIPNWLSRYILLTDGHRIQHIGAASRIRKKLQSFVQQSSETLEHEGEQASGPKESDELAMDENVSEPRRRGRPRKEIKATSEADLQLLKDSRELLKGLVASEPKEYMRDWQRVFRLENRRHSKVAWMKESSDGFESLDSKPLPEGGEPMIEMKGVRVAYGNKMVLGNWNQDDTTKEQGLWWTVRRGERWGVFGPNGSGKTTLTALISSDHPQSYSLPIEFFGCPRLPEKGKLGMSFFDIQARIGFSSPELHAFFPKNISIRQALESAWADTPLGKTNLSPDLDDRVSALLTWFQAELCPELGMTELQKKELYRVIGNDVQTYNGLKVNRAIKARYDGRVNETIMANELLSWADEKTFGSLSFVSQRLLLFLRAIVKRPDIVILDEAFSGMDPFVVQKCHTFLAHGDQKTLRLVRKQPKKICEPYVRRSEIDRFGLSKFPGLSDQQALIMIAHRKEEVPGNIRHWLALPEPGEGAPRFGTWDGPLQLDPNKWREVWGLPLIQMRRTPDTLVDPPAYILKRQQPPTKLVSRRNVAVRRDLEKMARQRMHLIRHWNRHNKYRDRVGYSSVLVRKLDTEFRRIKLAMDMDKPEFGTLDKAAQLTTKAEFAFHETFALLKHVNMKLWERSKTRLQRRELRKRSTHKLPRSTALMATRYKSRTHNVGVHGF